MKGLLGVALPLGSVGPRKVAQNPTTWQAQPPIQINRWIRNSRHPNASLASTLGQHANAAALFRTKEVCSFSASIPQLVSMGAGAHSHWRFAFHSGPYTTQLMVIMLLAPPTQGYSANAYGLFEIRDSAGSALIASDTFPYGPSPIGAATARGWQYIKQVRKQLTISPDTDYTVTISSVDNAMIYACTAFELPALTENSSGYLPQNYSAKGSILDLHRQNLAAQIKNVWRRGGAHVLNWSISDRSIAATPITTTSATMTNVIDNATTTVTAASLGYSLVMTGKDRVSQTTGVPVRISALASASTAAATNTGSLQLKNASGTVIPLITNGWATNGTATWVWANAVIPATADKWDLMYSSDGTRTFSLYCVSIMEYDP
jgi:hypothetical protein